MLYIIMETMKKIICLFALFLACYTAPAGDLVDSLPDYPYSTSRIYSGYLNVSGTERKLHYVFVESQGPVPNLAPLTLWLNGGPGCSSLIGFGDENGPAVMESEISLNLMINPFSWNKHSNILYIEGPAGVGFSVADPKYIPTDSNTASDETAALLEFFRLFSEYKENDFFIAGESYAGVYIPNLASQIINYNKNSEDFKFNLKGLFIGNGVTHPDLDESSVPDFLFSHSIINLKVKQDYYKYCIEDSADYEDFKCKQVFQKINEYLTHINAYDVLRKCDRIGGFKNFNYRRTAWLYRKTHIKEKKIEEVNGYDDCSSGNGIRNYFNREDVQKALNVDPRNDWSDCDNKVGEIFQPDDRASFYLYTDLIKMNLRIWHYNGDTDSVVPFNGTLAWMKLLKLNVIKAWHQWKLSPDSEFISGYKIDYNGLSFMTVRGIGHMVPQWKREEALYLFKCFLEGADI